MFAIRRVVGVVNPCKSHIRCVSALKKTPFDFDTFVAENEPMYSYGPGCDERKELLDNLDTYKNQVKNIPIHIGEEEIFTDDVHYQVCPFDHNRKIAKFSYATPEMVQKAIDNSLSVRKEWERRPLKERARIFHDAADLMATKYRADLLATTMLGQAKNIIQAEIDAAAELIDFCRFNVQYSREMTAFQPLSPDSDITNQTKYRGLEGFWATVTPFNFTAIGGHLPMAAALMGNVCLWKPSDTAMLSNYLVYQIYKEAGLPPGVINFIPADGPMFGNVVTDSPDLCGINFTGSVKTFRTLWRKVGENIDNFKTYPRMIGECGGKNMHFVHPSADYKSVVYGSIKSGFEYSGQKCSALSRMYCPESLWPKIRKGMTDITEKIKVGSALDPQTFVSAVIDDKSFARCKSYIEHAKSSPDTEIVAGGTYDDSKGYFVEPTIISTTNPSEKLMQEEIFGPIVTVHVYPDEKWAEISKLANNTSPYSLTAAIYAEDPKVVESLSEEFRDTAGNFYVNNKSTGSVVGQQPFGGTRLSGTNDKAGGPHYLMRFSSPQSVKTSHKPDSEWTYPHMAPK